MMGQRAQSKAIKVRTAGQIVVATAPRLAILSAAYMHTNPTNGGRARAARLRLSQIRTDAGTQSRAAISERTGADYAERMIAGDRFPPVACLILRQREEDE